MIAVILAKLRSPAWSPRSFRTLRWRRYRADRLVISTNMIRTKAAAHACWCWTGSGDSEYVKILKGIVATGWRGSDVVVFVKSVVVKRIGAVSPAARATASVVPVTIPPSVVG